MLTRLKVDGFKNLVNVDVRFGAFTCIAGANGVGKSNLFDAIAFMSALADRSIVEAALSVRDEAGRGGDLRDLFHRSGLQQADEMSFEAEMIISPSGLDDFGQPARATTTFLRYSLRLKYRGDEGAYPIELLSEELSHINLTEWRDHLRFETSKEWRDSALQGRRTTPLISTDEIKRSIKLHQDGGSSGRPLERHAANLPRTILSASNAAESPTVLLARREMQSWRLLQLEPSVLRRPDEFTASPRLAVDGSHLPAMLYHLSRSNPNVYYQLVATLSELIEDVQEVLIDRDDKREIYTLQVRAVDGTTHSAKALSDGTLRFLALAALRLDSTDTGVICLEEPENGIHPLRIPAMLHLLEGIAVDTMAPMGTDNPLRQVIINTHSPVIVRGIKPDELLAAKQVERLDDEGNRYTHVQFLGLSDTWRTKHEEESIPLGDLLAYLSPIDRQYFDEGRVVDREDVRQLILPDFSSEIE